MAVTGSLNHRREGEKRRKCQRLQNTQRGGNRTHVYIPGVEFETFPRVVLLPLNYALMMLL